MTCPLLTAIPVLHVLYILQLNFIYNPHKNYLYPASVEEATAVDRHLEIVSFYRFLR